MNRLADFSAFGKGPAHSTQSLAAPRWNERLIQNEAAPWPGCFSFDHELRVHYIRAMKNITFSADEQLIELAREEARTHRTTLNSLFREWLADLARRDEVRAKADEAIHNLSAHLSFDHKLTREELNER